MDYRILREFDSALRDLQIIANRGKIPPDQYVKEQQSAIRLIKAIQNRTKKIRVIIERIAKPPSL